MSDPSSDLRSAHRCARSAGPHVSARGGTECKSSTETCRALLLSTLARPGLTTAAAAGSALDAQGSAGDQGDKDEGDLAKAVQNPVADLISVPFQNNTSYNIGTNERASNTLNIQPVIPVHLSERVLLISADHSPHHLPARSDQHRGRDVGVRRHQPDVLLLAAKPGKLIWGVGPAFILPTATSASVGTGKWSVGSRGGGVDPAGPLDHRGARFPGLVVRRPLRSIDGQPDDGPVLRELQPRPRLVSDQLAHPDLQLGGDVERGVDGAVRRRHRQDLQAGEAPPQRIAAGLLQRSLGRIDDAGALAGAGAAGVPVPGRRQQAQAA